MTSFKTTLKIGLAASLLAMTTAASATTVSVTASATVDNAVDLTFTGALGFGTIRANISAVDAQCVGLELDADTTVTSLGTSPAGTDFAAACPAAGTSSIASIDGAFERPEFSITGVPAFQTLTITEPSATILTLTGSPTGEATFTLYDFTAYQTNSTPAEAVDISTGTGTFTANVDGEVTFTMGATIATDALGSTVDDYQDASYSGSFDVEVNY